MISVLTRLLHGYNTKQFDMLKSQLLQSNQSRSSALLLLLAICSIVSVPWSTSFPQLVYPAILIAVLSSPQIRQDIAQSAKWPINILGICFSLALFLGIAYSISPLPYAFNTWYKISHKIILFILLPALFVRKENRDRLIHAFLLSTTLIAALQIMHLHQWIDLVGFTHKKDLLHLINPIPFSVLCAYAMFVILHLCQRAYAQAQHPLFDWFAKCFAFCVLGYFMCFAMPKRTGLLVLGALMPFLVMSTTDKKKRGPILLLGCLMAVLMLAASPKLLNAVSLVIHETKLYFQGHVEQYSIGLRWSFIAMSVGLIKKSLFWGYGTGSFPWVYFAVGGPQLAGEKGLLGDPHSTFFHIMVQLGIPGGLLLISWLALQYQISKQMPAYEQLLAKGLVIAFVLTCFCIDGLLRSHMSMFYVIMLPALMGSCLEKNKKA